MRGPWSRAAWREQRGTTLPELVIAMTLFGLLLVPTILLWQTTQQSYFESAEMAEAQGNVRVAVDQVAHDVRRAGLDLTGTAFASQAVIPAATATTLQVRMDLNDDGGITASSDEDVTYAFDAATQRLTRNGQTLAESIGAAAFTYWWSPVVGTGCGAGALTSGQTPTTAQRTCIRRVTITLTGQATIGGQTVTRTARTDVDLRAR